MQGPCAADNTTVEHVATLGELGGAEPTVEVQFNPGDWGAVSAYVLLTKEEVSYAAVLDDTMSLYGASLISPFEKRMLTDLFVARGIATQVFPNQEFTYREVPCPLETNRDEQIFFDVCAAGSDQAMMTVASNAMHILINVRFAGDTEFRDVAILPGENGPEYMIDY